MRLLLIGLCVAAGSLAATYDRGAPAGAAGLNTCFGFYYPGNQCTLPYLVPLTGSLAFDDSGGNHRVCAAALDSNGNFYGGWACSYGYAEHCYGGGNWLYAQVGSGDYNVYFGFGEEVWNDGCP